MSDVEIRQLFAGLLKHGGSDKLIAKVRAEVERRRIRGMQVGRAA